MKIPNKELVPNNLVRVVVRKETNFQNRKTLFDSSSITRETISSDNTENFGRYDEISNHYGYKVALNMHNLSRIK